MLSSYSVDTKSCVLVEVQLKTAAISNVNGLELTMYLLIFLLNYFWCFLPNKLVVGEGHRNMVTDGVQEVGLLKLVEKDMGIFKDCS